MAHDLRAATVARHWTAFKASKAATSSRLKTSTIIDAILEIRDISHHNSIFGIPVTFLRPVEGHSFSPVSINLRQGLFAGSKAFATTTNHRGCEVTVREHQ